MKKIIFPLAMLFLAGCYSDKESELYPSPTATGGGCDTANMTFAKVQPILNQSCALAGCHDAVTKSLGHDLSSHTGAVAAVNSGRMLGAIQHDAGYLQMPKGMTKLNDCQVSQITAWVNAGMPQ